MTPRTLCALALAVTLSSACGGGSGSGLSAGKTPTKDDATAAATKINLVKGDVPDDWKSSPHDASDSSDDKKIETELTACLGVSAGSFSGDADDVVDIDSDDFAKGAPPQGLQANSSVAVVKSGGSAKKDLALFKNSKTPDCLQQVFDKLLKEQVASQAGVTLGTVDVKRLDPKKDGTDGTFGFEVSVTVGGGGLSIPVSIDILGFLKKHTEVTLMTTAFGSTFSTSDRDGLYDKLVSRAKSAAV